MSVLVTNPGYCDRTSPITISWTNNDSIYNGHQSSYEIQYKLPWASSWSTLGTVSSSATSCSLNGIFDAVGEDAEEYFFRLCIKYNYFISSTLGARAAGTDFSDIYSIAFHGKQVGTIKLYTGKETISLPVYDSVRGSKSTLNVMVTSSTKGQVPVVSGPSPFSSRVKTSLGQVLSDTGLSGGRRGYANGYFYGYKYQYSTYYYPVYGYYNYSYYSYSYPIYGTYNYQYSYSYYNYSYPVYNYYYYYYNYSYQNYTASVYYYYNYSHLDGFSSIYSYAGYYNSMIYYETPATPIYYKYYYNYYYYYYNFTYTYSINVRAYYAYVAYYYRYGYTRRGYSDTIINRYYYYKDSAIAWDYQQYTYWANAINPYPLYYSADSIASRSATSYWYLHYDITSGYYKYWTYYSYISGYRNIYSIWQGSDIDYYYHVYAYDSSKVNASRVNYYNKVYSSAYSYAYKYYLSRYNHAYAYAYRSQLTSYGKYYSIFGYNYGYYRLE